MYEELKKSLNECKDLEELNFMFSNLQLAYKQKGITKEQCVELMEDAKFKVLTIMEKMLDEVIELIKKQS